MKITVKSHCNDSLYFQPSFLPSKESLIFVKKNIYIFFYIQNVHYVYYVGVYRKGIGYKIPE